MNLTQLSFEHADLWGISFFCLPSVIFFIFNPIIKNSSGDSRFMSVTMIIPCTWTPTTARKVAVSQCKKAEEKKMNQAQRVHTSQSNDCKETQNISKSKHKMKLKLTFSKLHNSLYTLKNAFLQCVKIFVGVPCHYFPWHEECWFLRSLLREVVQRWSW